MCALHTLFHYSADNTLRIWGLGPGVRGRQRLRRSSVRQWTQQPLPARPVRTLHGHVSCVACLCASADLDVVVSGGANGLCYIHRLSQGIILHVISPDHSLGTPVAIRGMVLTQDGEVIMMLGDRSLRTVDVNSNTTGMVANPSEGLVSNICLSSDGHVVFISGKEGPITACSARTLVSAGCLPAEAAMKDGRLAMMWLDRRGFFNKPKVPDIPITTQQSSVLEKEEIKEDKDKKAVCFSISFHILYV